MSSPTFTQQKKNGLVLLFVFVFYSCLLSICLVIAQTKNHPPPENYLFGQHLFQEIFNFTAATCNKD
jgi:hypothetical protein